jgi:hypothetical protein
MTSEQPTAPRWFAPMDGVTLECGREKAWAWAELLGRCNLTGYRMIAVYSRIFLSTVGLIVGLQLQVV